MGQLDIEFGELRLDGDGDCVMLFPPIKRRQMAVRGHIDMTVTNRVSRSPLLQQGKERLLRKREPGSHLLHSLRSVFPAPKASGGSTGGAVV